MVKRMIGPLNRDLQFWPHPGGRTPIFTDPVAGGGALRFEWVPTAKQPIGVEAVNAKTLGVVNSFWGKTGGPSTSKKDHSRNNSL